MVKARKTGRAPRAQVGGAKPRSVEYQTAGGQKVIIMLGPDDGPDAIVAILEDVLEQARGGVGTIEPLQSTAPPYHCQKPRSSPVLNPSADDPRPRAR